MGQTDLTPQHKDGVDVRQDAMETEVYVRPHQREHRGQVTDARLQLEDNTHNLTLFLHHTLLNHHIYT